MQPQHINYLKTLILVRLHEHGSVALSNQPWDEIIEKLHCSTKDLPEFFHHVIQELVDSKIIVIAKEKAFLRRPLNDVSTRIEINLSTSIEIARALKMVTTDEDSYFPDPSDLNARDVDAFVALLYAAFEQLQKANSHVESAERRAESLDEEIKGLKMTLKQYQDEEMKAVRERNRLLKEEKMAKATKALESHAIVSGLCSKCGLSEQLIKDSLIVCDGGHIAN